ncbi:hypothetical protein DPMN_021489 [Dreissena polymorpha]|uniref:Uncharacterized protein n=1 Tax=Dreissena polymorpha TaxID=45954 RepID=A0A9D4SBT1_DREPO|nr:hypothetical protein DPMN_021489 [Dreissena polymorpha]
MDRQRPAWHREQPGRHREQPKRYRSSTGAHTDPDKATSSPGGALVNADRVPGELRRGITGECRRSYGIPGLCRDAAGFHRGSSGAQLGNYR